MFSKSKINSKWYFLNWSNVLYATIENGKCHIFFDKPVDGMTDAFLDDILPEQLQIMLIPRRKDE